MKKGKKILAITLGALLICVGINIVYEREDPRPMGEIQTIHLG